MSVLPDAIPAGTRTAAVWPMLFRQVWAEITINIRMPMGYIWAIVVTSILYLFLGFGFAGRDVAGIDGKLFMVASFATFGTFNIMVSTFGGGVASDRSARRHVLYRAMPVRPIVLLGAKAVVACAVTMIMCTILIGTAVATGTRIAPLDAVSLVARMAIGGIPFIAMGLAIGYLVRPSSVGVVINVLSLGLSFLSGIYMPIQVTEGALQPIANVLPMYRLAELGWNAVGADIANSMLESILVLVAYTLVFGAIALYAYGREEKRTFE